MPRPSTLPTETGMRLGAAGGRQRGEDGRAIRIVHADRSTWPSLGTWRSSRALMAA